MNARKTRWTERVGIQPIESKGRPKQAESKKAVVECRVQANVRSFSGSRRAETRETTAEIRVPKYQLNDHENDV
jgi:hypothetical protein